MKKILLLCCLVFINQLVWSQITVKLTAPKLILTESSLSFYGKEYKAMFDSLGVVNFKINSSKYGYGEVSFGRTKMRIYLEPKSNLQITYLDKVDKVSGLRYIIEGTTANENLFFHKNDYKDYQLLHNEQTQFSDLVSYLKKLIAENHTIIDNLNLSEKFKELEKKRIKYLNSGYYTKFHKWSNEVYDYLRPLAIADERLFFIEEYRNFMKNAVYVMGYENQADSKSMNHLKGEFSFVENRLKRGIVNDYLVADIIVKYIKQNGIDENEELINRFRLKVKDSKLREQIDDTYNTWIGIQKGVEIPNFSFKDRTGKNVSLADFKGKYIFIDCWASWCGPCRQQIPHLKKIEKEFEGKNILFIGISSDTDHKKWLEALDSHVLEGVQLLDSDPNSEFAIFFQITTIPRFILLDKEGKVLKAIMSRPSDEGTRKMLINLDI